MEKLARGKKRFAGGTSTFKKTAGFTCGDCATELNAPTWDWKPWEKCDLQGKRCQRCGKLVLKGDQCGFPVF